MKESILLFAITFLLFPIVSASCSDVDLKITGVNMKYNFMKGEINLGEAEIKEIRVYLNDDLKMTDVSDTFKENILFPSFKEPLAEGQEIRLDVVLKDGTLCKNEESLVVSADKIMTPVPECDYSQKKEDWCIGDFVWGIHCKDGVWIDFIDVDCSYWGGTCKNGKCIESGNEDNMPTLTTPIQTTEVEENLNTITDEGITASSNELESTELIQNRSEDNSSVENSSTNPIRIILNWLISLFR